MTLIWAMKAPDVHREKQEGANSRHRGREERDGAGELNNTCEVTKPLTQSDCFELLHHHGLAAELDKGREQEKRSHQDA
jgi:hypothetical protein